MAQLRTDQVPPHSPPRTEEEIIFESSLESFPASDPPAWVYGKDRPLEEDAAPDRARSISESKKEGFLKRILLRFWSSVDGRS